MTIALKPALSRLRIYLAVGLLLVPALVHAAAILSLAIGAWPDPDYRASQLVQACDRTGMCRLQEVLAPSTRIGFLDDPALPPGDHVRRYYLTQYAVAPVIVLDDPALPTVLGNFGDQQRLPRPAAGTRYELMVDLGGGIRLYRVRSQ
jgi:hypothetical protein